jgi:Uma2 family endonuclease
VPGTTRVRIAPLRVDDSSLESGARRRLSRSHADLRIRVEKTGLASYPDVAVVCGGWKRDPEDPNTILNPLVLVEVLSPSTEAYDRGEKLEHYRTIPSLRACLLIAHDRREIELWMREPDQPWTRSLVGAGGALEIAAIGAKLAVDAVYDDAKKTGQA